jgi:hypothetical protein
MNTERLRKLLLYQKYIAYCIERELGLPARDDAPQKPQEPRPPKPSDDAQNDNTSR